jgi:hypothetical protein
VLLQRIPSRGRHFDYIEDFIVAPRHGTGRQGHRHQCRQGHRHQCRQGHRHQCRQGHRHQCRQGHGHQCRQGHRHQCRQGHGHQCRQGHRHQCRQRHSQRPLVFKKVNVKRMARSAVMIYHRCATISFFSRTYFDIWTALTMTNIQHRSARPGSIILHPSHTPTNPLSPPIPHHSSPQTDPLVPCEFGGQIRGHDEFEAVKLIGRREEFLISGTSMSYSIPLDSVS